MATTIHEILKSHWGFDSFRSKQQDIIESVIAGKDTLALLPTGGGKSVCFQIPGLYLGGCTIVVSPLIALMKDQVRQLKKRGIIAECLVSGMSKTAIDQALDNCIYGNTKFLYVSPERLKTELFLARLPSIKCNLIAVDEAHCISQWGYDFRPDYLEVASIREYLPKVPIIALSQLSRAVEQRDDHKPQLSDLRESGSIEQDADVVMFVYREAYYLERKEPRPATVEHAEWQAKMNEVSNLAELIIGKQRHGPTGNVMVEFEAMFTKFKDTQIN